jgi:S1-C subfamily serine protease
MTASLKKFLYFFNILILFLVLLLLGDRMGWYSIPLFHQFTVNQAPDREFTPAAPPSISAAAAVSNADIPLLSQLNEEYAKLSAAVLPTVVSINTQTLKKGGIYRNPLYGLVRVNDQLIPGLGSGAFISKEGLIITNYHVIKGVSEVQIITNDKRKFSATILGFNKEIDIAILKINAPDTTFPFLTFADSDKVRVGQMVFAVGNPFGLSGTVTQGIISARDRRLSDSETDYLQTDTVINPGNSGGPLIDIHGQILGINVAIYRGDENVQAWQGIGLAIPANNIQQILNQYYNQSRSSEPLQQTAFKPAFLGIGVEADLVFVNRRLGFGRAAIQLSYIHPNSPADAAGLKVKDLILLADEQPFNDPSDLLTLLQSKKPGEIIRLRVMSAGQVQDIDIPLIERPSS